eukprot:SAG31_NODE_3373_length_4351_cov_2.070790_1_plen_84_part_00
MKYFVMTTKHHDGFAMYNTSAHGAPGQPVYGVTGPDCPAQRDLFGEVVSAMRNEGMIVGAYYSKADCEPSREHLSSAPTCSGG